MLPSEALAELLALRHKLENAMPSDAHRSQADESLWTVRVTSRFRAYHFRDYEMPLSEIVEKLESGELRSKRTLVCTPGGGAFLKPHEVRELFPALTMAGGSDIPLSFARPESNASHLPQASIEGKTAVLMPSDRMCVMAWPHKCALCGTEGLDLGHCDSVELPIGGLDSSLWFPICTGCQSRSLRARIFRRLGEALVWLSLPLLLLLAPWSLLFCLVATVVVLGSVVCVLGHLWMKRHFLKCRLQKDGSLLITFPTEERAREFRDVNS